MQPAVTVLLPVYNGAATLAEAMDSILAQSFTDFELLVIDDGSTDGSGDIAAAYQDPRVRLEINTRNLGIIASLNRGLELARGRYLARMDADDIAYPTRLERQVAFMEAHPEVGIVSGWMRYFGELELVITMPPDHGHLHAHLLLDNSIFHPAVMLRRRFYTEQGYRYDPAAENAEDYDLWERAFAAGVRAATLQTPLLRYRVHPAQCGSASREKQHATANTIRRRQLERLGVAPTDKEWQLHLTLCFGAYRLDDPGYPEALLAWLERLIAANDAARVYPEPAFTQVLAYRLCHYLRCGWRRIPRKNFLHAVARFGPPALAYAAATPRMTLATRLPRLAARIWR